MDDEMYFLYSEYLDNSRMYLWYQGSKFSHHKNKESKADAERHRYLSNYYWEKVVNKARSMRPPK